MGSEGVRQASVVTTGNLVATGISAIAMIIFSRFLGPEQFGIFSALFSVLMILSKIGDLGVNLTSQRFVAQENNSLATTRLVQTSLYLKIVLSLVLVVVGLVGADWIATSLLRLPAQSHLVRLVFVLSVGVILYEFVASLLTGLQRFNQAVVLNLIQSTGKLVIGSTILYLGYLTVGTVILLYGILPFLASIYGISALPSTLFKISFHKQSLLRILTVGKWMGVAVISASLAEDIDIVIIKNLLTSYDTGIWSSAVRIATLASLIGWSIGSVLSVRVAKYRDKVHLDSYLRKAVLLAIFSALLVLFLIPFSSLLLTLTVGVEYLAASQSLQLLLISTAILTATIPFGALFYLFDAPQYFAYAGILSSFILIAGDFLLIPVFGTLGAGYARIIMRLIVLLFTLAYARRAYLYRYGK